MINIKFDTQTQQLDIQRVGEHPYGADIVGSLNRHGQVISLRGVQFGINVKADNEIILNQVYPPPNVRYIQTDQDILAPARTEWKPEQTIIIDAWVITALGDRVEAHEQFVAPRPLQPYPSWVWENSKWNPPIPYPRDGFWQWNEDEQKWQPIDVNIF